jgi:glyoxylase-like metal-dependent hydrolase (beta-lactamase superfamily II)
MIITALSARNPGPFTGTGNNTWLIDGPEPVLIDAGTGRQDHLDDLRRHLGDRALARVLVTHRHSDHASGADAIRREWPAVELWKFPAPIGVEEIGSVRWSPLHEGQWLPAGDRRLQVVHTPGHSPDHVCFWEPHDRDLFGGDLVLRDTTVLIPGGRDGDLRAYLASLERVRHLAPVRILPGHGPIVDRPDEVIAGYQTHRRTRERQVLACLAEGITDPDAIVARIYPKVPPPLIPAARMTILAHLEKIRADAAG